MDRPGARVRLSLIQPSFLELPEDQQRYRVFRKRRDRASREAMATRKQEAKIKRGLAAIPLDKLRELLGP